jgi:hypothetical protein
MALFKRNYFLTPCFAIDFTVDVLFSSPSYGLLLMRNVKRTSLYNSLLKFVTILKYIQDYGNNTFLNILKGKKNDYYNSKYIVKTEHFLCF